MTENQTPQSRAANEAGRRYEALSDEQRERIHEIAKVRTATRAARKALLEEFGDKASQFHYSDGGVQVVLRDTDRPDLGSVVRYSDGTSETTVTLAG